MNRLIYKIITFLLPPVAIIGPWSCTRNTKILEKTGRNENPNIVIILADDLGYGDLSSFGATLVNTPNIDRLAEEGIRFTNAYSPSSVSTPTRYGLLTGQYAWRTWNGHETVWADDPLLVDTTRTTLPKLLKAEGYQTAIIGKWHLGFGAPDMPGWDDITGPDYNEELKPGPLEIGFDYFYGIPHVGQQPHMFIENHHVVGLGKEDTMRIILDKKFLNRPSFEDRANMPPAHRFTGYDSAKYEHEKVAMRITKKAVDWIGSQGKEPFFLYFAHRNVHGPLKPNEHFAGTSEIGVYGDFINELDWSVGEILKALDSKGVIDNTIIIFASDNGGVKDYLASKIIDYNGHKPNGPFFGQKTEVFEGGVHVPMIVRWPEIIKAGSQSGKIVALTDVFATVAEMMNRPLKWNEGEDSFSFLYELEGRKPVQAVRESIVVDSKSGVFGIREGDWKFIAGQGGGGAHWDSAKNIRMSTHEWNYSQNYDNPPGQLYNLKEDPGERTNLYYSHPEIVVKLRSRLREIQYYGRSR